MPLVPVLVRRLLPWLAKHSHQLFEASRSGGDHESYPHGQANLCAVVGAAAVSIYSEEAMTVLLIVMASVTRRVVLQRYSLLLLDAPPLLHQYYRLDGYNLRQSRMKKLWNPPYCS